MSETVKWYVIHTYSGYENKVSQNIEKVVENHKLDDLIHEVKVPMETVIEMKDDKRQEVERKIFPGYVLVKMILTDDSWYVVRNIRGVTGFVGSASKPIPLTEKEVKALGVEVKTLITGYDVGDTVKVIHGPLDGFIGIIESMDVENNSVMVVVSMFGRETPVELELDQIVNCD
ncbi:MAG: transcription termination/antitermination factor NusG [Oscillospiraceae bacterium]|nr:transcription termination/antitermination factor NusG [Oscillospiraceae bacterium]